ncbi:hypothetical protein MTO96_025928 [Rhipicephalus appendiculatus]
MNVDTNTAYTSNAAATVVRVNYAAQPDLQRVRGLCPRLSIRHAAVVSVSRFRNIRGLSTAAPIDIITNPRFHSARLIFRRLAVYRGDLEPPTESDLPAQNTHSADTARRSVLRLSRGHGHPHFLSRTYFGGALDNDIRPENAPIRL